MSEILDDGPIGYWPLTDDISDYSGNGHTLTTYSAGSFQQGYYEPIGNSGSRGTKIWDTGVGLGSGDWTLEFFCEQYDHSENVLFTDDPTLTAGGGAYYNDFMLSLMGAGSVGFSYPGGNPFDHYILVSALGSITLYHGVHQNGAPTSTVDSYALGSQSPSGNVLVGGGYAFYAQVAIYDYALSPERVLAHYTGTTLTPSDEPTGLDSLDDFAADGPITDSVPHYGTAWSHSGSGGTESITSGVWASDELTGENTLGLTGPPWDPFCLSSPSTLTMTVELPVDFNVPVFVFLGWAQTGAYSGVGAYVSAYGAAGIGRWGPAGYDGPSSVPADITDGTHTLTVRRSGDPDDVSIEVWWDGVWMTCGSIPEADFSEQSCNYSPMFGHYRNYDNLTIGYSDLRFILGSGEHGGLEAPDLTGGLSRIYGADLNLYVGGIEAPNLLGGLDAPIDVSVISDVFAGGLDAPFLTGGPAYSYTDPGPSPPPAPIPPTPHYQYGPPSADILVTGYPYRKNASVSFSMNAGGTGNFETLPPGPSAGDAVSVTVAGATVFTGYAAPSDHQVATGEEDEQTVSVELTSLLEVDLTETVVWPDIAASDPQRLGRPPQDDRTWDWHSNVVEISSAELTSSFGGDNAIYGTAKENHPFPDNWPDPFSRWMWDRNPDVPGIPAGWVYFRVQHGVLFAKSLAMFVCAWDYAVVHYDGQLVIEADQPGATFRYDFDTDWDYHLITIAAYTAGGKAGVNFTLMPKEKAGFTPSVMNSRPGWKCLGYPKKPLRFTTGRVLERLFDEAKSRGAPAGGWTLAFDRNSDSAGNPWPTDESVITTRVGMTYWDVLNQLAEDRLDFRASPSGRTLYAYVKGKVPRTIGNPWTAGVDLSDMSVDTSTR